MYHQNKLKTIQTKVLGLETDNGLGVYEDSFHTFEPPSLPSSVTPSPSDPQPSKPGIIGKLLGKSSTDDTPPVPETPRNTQSLVSNLDILPDVQTASSLIKEAVDAQVPTVELNALLLTQSNVGIEEKTFQSDREREASAASAAQEEADSKSKQVKIPQKSSKPTDPEASASSTPKQKKTKKSGLFSRLFGSETPQVAPPNPQVVVTQVVTTQKHYNYAGPRLDQKVTPGLNSLQQLLDAAPSATHANHGITGFGISPNAPNDFDIEEYFNLLANTLKAAQYQKRMKLAHYRSSLRKGPLTFSRFVAPPKLLRYQYYKLSFNIGGTIRQPDSSNGSRVNFPYSAMPSAPRCISIPGLQDPYPVDSPTKPASSIVPMPMTATLLIKSDPNVPSNSTPQNIQFQGFYGVHPRLGLGAASSCGSLNALSGTTIDSSEFHPVGLFESTKRLESQNLANSIVAPLNRRKFPSFSSVTPPHFRCSKIYQNCQNSPYDIEMPSTSSSSQGEQLSLGTSQVFSTQESFYFEMVILNRGTDGAIAIGFGAPNGSLLGLPGWRDGSIGYHGDDGKVFSPQTGGQGSPWGPTYTTGDVVGAGYDSIRCAFFFTRNGKFLGFSSLLASTPAMSDSFRPLIGLHTPGAKIRVTFGVSGYPFPHPLDSYCIWRQPNVSLLPFSFDAGNEWALSFADSPCIQPTKMKVTILKMTPKSRSNIDSSLVVGFSCLPPQISGRSVGEFYLPPGRMPYSCGFDTQSGFFNVSGGYGIGKPCSAPVANSLGVGSVIEMSYSPESNTCGLIIDNIPIYLDGVSLGTSFLKADSLVWPVIAIAQNDIVVSVEFHSGSNSNDTFSLVQTPVQWLNSSTINKLKPINSMILSNVDSKKLQIRSGLDFQLSGNDDQDSISVIDPEIALSVLQAQNIRSKPSSHILDAAQLMFLAEKAKKGKEDDDEEDEEEDEEVPEDDEEDENDRQPSNIKKYLSHPLVDPLSTATSIQDESRKHVLLSISQAYKALDAAAARPLVYQCALVNESKTLSIGPGLILASQFLKQTKELIANLEKIEINDAIDKLLFKSALSVFSRFIKDILPFCLVLLDGQVPNLYAMSPLVVKCASQIFAVARFHIGFYISQIRLGHLVSSLVHIPRFPFLRLPGSQNPLNITTRTQVGSVNSVLPEYPIEYPLKSSVSTPEFTANDANNALVGYSTSNNLAALVFAEQVSFAIDSFGWIFSKDSVNGVAQLYSILSNFPVPYKTSSFVNPHTGQLVVPPKVEKYVPGTPFTPPSESKPKPKAADSENSLFENQKINAFDSTLEQSKACDAFFNQFTEYIQTSIKLMTGSDPEMEKYVSDLEISL